MGVSSLLEMKKHFKTIINITYITFAHLHIYKVLYKFLWYNFYYKGYVTKVVIMLIVRILRVK